MSIATPTPRSSAAAFSASPRSQATPVEAVEAQPLLLQRDAREILFDVQPPSPDIRPRLRARGRTASRRGFLQVTATGAAPVRA